MHPPPNSSCLFFILLALLTITSAQFPTLARFAVGATIEDKIFLIAGGVDDNRFFNQLMALDLTVPTWPTSNPPWKRLQSFPETLTARLQHATLIQSSTQLFCTIGGYSKAFYSLDSDTWSSVTPLPYGYDTANGTVAETDPGTDQIFVPTGEYQSPGSLLFNPVSNIATPAPGIDLASAPGVTIPPDIINYATAWSTERKSVLVYGGVGGQNGIRSVLNTHLLEYVPSTRTWSIVETTGDDPGARNFSCLVPAYKGKMMVLFGGTVGSTTLNSIYSLNISSLTWTKGMDVNSTLGRYGHVCTSAGDSFMAWGGARANDAIPPAFAEPIVYDLRNGGWTRQFALNTNKTPGPSKLNPSKPGTTNVGAIVGGVIGTLVVVCVLAFFFYRRHKAAGGPWFIKSRGGALSEEPADPAKRNSKVDMATVEPTPVILANPRPFPPPFFLPVKIGKDTVECAPVVLESPRPLPHAAYVPVSAYNPTAIAPPSTQVSPSKVEARHPQFRDSILDSDHPGAKANPQEYPEGQHFDQDDYFSTPSLPSPPLTMSPLSQYQAYDSYKSPPPTSNWPVLIPGNGRAQEFVVNPVVTSTLGGERRQGSVEDAAQRRSKEILKETQKVQQMELELRIHQSRQNIQKLMDVEQAQMLSGPPRDWQ